MTINTDADVIRVIQQNPRLLIEAITAHPELRAEVRRAVLTDELLAMPEQLAEMHESLAETRETQNEMLKVQGEILKSLTETRESLAETRETQNEMLKVQGEILKSLGEMRETQNRMLEEQANVRGDIGALHGMYRRQHEDFGRFRGAYAIDAARRKSGDIARVLARSSAHRLRRVVVRDFSQADINEFLVENYDALDALHLRERAWNTFLKGDVLAKVTQVVGDTPGFYMAVEASYTADIEDLRRAVDHAKMLRCAGLAAYAVVAGVRKHLSIEGRLYEGLEEFVSAQDEDAALWFPLDLKDVQPDDPY